VATNHRTRAPHPVTQRWLKEVLSSGSRHPFQRELGHQEAKTWDVIELVAMAMGQPKA